MNIKLHFEKKDFISRFHDPRKNYEMIEVKGEIRTDPLTGLTGHIAHTGTVSLQEPDLKEFNQPEARESCPFCPGRREKVTPRFLEEFISGGHLLRNEALVVPNLAPYDTQSSLVIMSKDHFIPLEDLSEDIILDSFLAAWDYFHQVNRYSPSLRHYLIGWNYMPPSGGSIIHPHLQLLATNHPGNLCRLEINKAEEHYLKYSSLLWDDFMETEKKIRERYIGNHQDVEWFASFVSQGMWGEALAVFPDAESIWDIREKHLCGLVSGLRCLFNYFKSKNIYSFNFAFYPGTKDQLGLRPHARIVPRFYLNPTTYSPDINTFQILFREPVSVNKPEQLCTEIRKHFP